MTIHERPRLSPRHIKVLILLAHGHKKKEIAGKLGIKYSTVRYYVEQIYARLGVSSLLEALVMTKTIYPEFTIPAVLDDLAQAQGSGR